MQVGGEGAKQLMAEEMSSRYSWHLALGTWQVLLASRSLPEDDGGERVPSKPVGWTERFPLQVKQEKCDILNAYRKCIHSYYS